MVTSKAATVAGYLDELDAERRGAIAAVRAVVLRNLPKGYEEAMGFGMIAYQVPRAAYPNTYNGQPLMLAALGAQKRHNAIYLMCAYGDESKHAALREAFRNAGKRFDMGKSCLRFKTAGDLVLDAIGELIRSSPPADLIEMHERAHGPAKRGSR